MLRKLISKSNLLPKPSRLRSTLFTDTKATSITKINDDTDQLLEHHLYQISARNSCVGIFTLAGPYNNLPGFKIARSKMEKTFLDFEILHEADEHHGTAIAIGLIEKSPAFSSSKQELEYLLMWRDKIDPSYTIDDKRICADYSIPRKSK